MVRILAAPVLAFLLMQDADWSRSLWAGYPDGSWVVIDTLQAGGGKTWTSRSKFTVRVGARGRIRLEVRMEKEGRFPDAPFEERSEHPSASLIASSGAPAKPQPAELHIGRRKVTCERTDYVKKSDRIETRTSVWRAKEIRLPYREFHARGEFALDPDIVQVERTLDFGGDLITFKLKVLEIDQKLKAGSTEVECFVEEESHHKKVDAKDFKSTVRRWMSDSVPGRLVKSEHRTPSNGIEVTETLQVTDFAIKK